MAQYTAYLNATFKVEADTKEEAMEIVAELLEYSIQNNLGKMITLVENT